ncbi:MAG: hypothetical protein ACI9S9_001135 [Planctomycetota bacterium]|jgi:hypothetical protein
MRNVPSLLAIGAGMPARTLASATNCRLVYLPRLPRLPRRLLSSASRTQLPTSELTSTLSLPGCTLSPSGPSCAASGATNATITTAARVSQRCIHPWNDKPSNAELLGSTTCVSTPPQVDQAVRQQIAVRQDGQATHACDQAWPYGVPCGDGITRRSPRRQPSARQPPTY